jgi:hypothetical protein
VNSTLIQIARAAEAAGVALPPRVVALQEGIARLQAQAGELRRRSPASVNLAIHDQAQALAKAAVAGGPLDVGKAAAQVSEAQWAASEAARVLPLLAASVGELERQLLVALREEADAIYAGLQAVWHTEIKPAAKKAGATLKGWDLAAPDVDAHIVRSGDPAAAAALATLTSLELRYRAMRDLQRALGVLAPVPEGLAEFRDGAHAKGLSRVRTARLVGVARLGATWFPTAAEAQKAEAEWQRIHGGISTAELHAAQTEANRPTREHYARKPVAVR